MSQTTKGKYRTYFPVITTALGSRFVVSDGVGCALAAEMVVVRVMRRRAKRAL